MYKYLTKTGVEKFAFYRVPKMLFTNKNFAAISCEAKLLYGLLLDRATLSIKKDWIDDEDRVYVYFKQTEAKEYLGIKGDAKVVTVFKELENIGLIIRKKGGQGTPTKIYVMNFSDFSEEDFESSENENRKSRPLKIESQEFQKSKVKTFEKQKSRPLKIESQDFRKSKVTFPYKNKTEINDTESSSSSVIDDDEDDDETTTQENIFSDVRNQINYDYLLDSKVDNTTLDLVVEIIAEAYLGKRISYNINSTTVPCSNVKAMFKKLDEEHIIFVLDRVENAARYSPIANIRNYLIVCLYNAPHTIDLSYDTQVSHDLNNSQNSKYSRSSAVSGAVHKSSPKKHETKSWSNLKNNRDFDFDTAAKEIMEAQLESQAVPVAERFETDTDNSFMSDFDYKAYEAVDMTDESADKKGYGFQGNVFLTDDEYEALRNDYPLSYSLILSNVSEYLYQHSNCDTDHFALCKQMSENF